MSSQTQATTKKRKNAKVEKAISGPSTKRSKVEEGGIKKVEKEKKRDKGKARADEGPFKLFQASLMLSIPPVFASDLRVGAEEMLDSMVMRYIPAFRGVLLAHDSLQFLESAATIKADCPFANIHVGFEAMVWCPQVGMKLGKVNLCSPDHIALLAHKTFNVSIPRRHIPTDNWEFEYGAAENDPEFGPPAGGKEEGAEGSDGVNSSGIEGSGRWVHKTTGYVLGGPTADLEFTVIGLTVANQMLSLVGSIQLDPFAVEEDHQRSAIPSNQRGAPPAASNEARTSADLPEDISSDSDEEPFDSLSRVRKKTVAEDLGRKAKEADETKGHTKRKRKEEKGKGPKDGNVKKAKS